VLARIHGAIIIFVTGKRDDLAEIAGDGTVQPLGERAALRLQARSGTYRVLQAPPHLVILREETAGSTSQACVLSGEIKSAGTLCDILSFVGHAGWRGVFVVQESNASRSIYFDQGYVVGAESTVVRERLGEVLYRYGVLTREQVDEASAATATGTLRFGEAAVKLGFLSRETLFDRMAHQTEDIFYGMLVVGNAMFYFLEDFEESELSSRQKLGLTTLMREGIRRMHEMRFFRARVPSERHVPVRAPGWSPPEPDLFGVYAAIDGRRSVAELCRKVNASEFDVTRTLFQLIQAGRIAMRAPHLAPKAAVEVYNQAIALILRELDAMDEGDAVRAQLASFAGRSPVYGELFAGAGPQDDGTLDAVRVEGNLAAMRERANEDALAACLHDYASYALFLARPHLQREEQGRTGAPRPRISLRVSALLEPIAPQKSGSNHRGGTKVE
jgi:hypothetical protein